MKSIERFVLFGIFVLIATFCISCDNNSQVENSNNNHSHTFSMWEITTKSTCTTQGMQTRVCSSCGFSEYSPIPAFGHTEVIDIAVSPTCSTKGKTEGKHCSACNLIIQAQTEIASLEHNYVQKSVDEPTCTENGTRYMECNVCGDKRTETIEALEHNWIEATYNLPQYCDRCGESVGAPLFNTNDLRYIVAAHCYQNVLDQAKFPSTVVIERAYCKGNIVYLDCSAANSLGGKGTIWGVSIVYTIEEYEEKYGDEGATYTDVNYYFDNEYYITCSTYDGSPIHTPSGEILIDDYIMLDIEGILLTHETINFD